MFITNFGAKALPSGVPMSMWMAMAFAFTKSATSFTPKIARSCCANAFSPSAFKGLRMASTKTIFPSFSALAAASSQERSWNTVFCACAENITPKNKITKILIRFITQYLFKQKECAKDKHWHNS